MGYRTLRDCVLDLRATGQLIVIDDEVDPKLEMAEVQRRLFRAGGPAVLFINPAGCTFPMLGNLFGTIERMRYLFRDTLETVRRLVALQVDPSELLRRPRLYSEAAVDGVACPAAAGLARAGAGLADHHRPTAAVEVLARRRRHLYHPPQVYTEDPERPGLARSNLGMYRVQLRGGQYAANREVGLHYQMHRGIGAHHAAAIRRKERLRVNVFVGGPPAMTVAAVMPLPEGISELGLRRHPGRARVPMICRPQKLPIHAEADFCIIGHLDPAGNCPRGPSAITWATTAWGTIFP